MNLESAGKTVVLTGGTSGIGRATVACLLSGNVNVIAIGRSRRFAGSIAGSIRGRSPDAVDPGRRPRSPTRADRTSRRSTAG